MFEVVKRFVKNNFSVRVLGLIKAVRTFLSLPVDCFYDFLRYMWFNSSFGLERDRVKLLSLIVKDYHRIEKGLALPDPRPGFGSDVIKRLVRNLEVYSVKYGACQDVFFALAALKEYQEFSRDCGVPQPWLESWWVEYVSSVNRESMSEGGGTISIRKDEIVDAITSGDFNSFFRSRFSIRCFSGEEVTSEDIGRAMDMAKKTPSVCNRQTAKVYFIRDERLKDQVLALQNGNRGFGHKASHIAVITSDIRCFEGAGERNQPFVDGGLMAMSLCYAFHSLGVGTCFLNWSVRAGVDRRLHKLLKISSSQVVITLMAIGGIPEELKVAFSPRKDVNNLYEIV